MDREERKMKEILSGIKLRQQGCPELEELNALIEGTLSDSEAERIREHLANCSDCLEKVRIEFLLEEEDLIPVPLKALEQAKSLFHPGVFRGAVNFIWNLFRAGEESRKLLPFKPAFAFRGAHPAKASQGLSGYLQEFGNYRAEVEVEQVNGQQWQVFVWVEQKDNRKPARGIRVSLMSQERELESLMLDRGRAVFEPVPAGEYRLSFQKLGKSIGGLIIRMKEEEK